MKIGILGPLSLPISKTSVGGAELFCYLLARGLKENGHELYLFATDDSQIPGVKTIPVAEKTYGFIRSNYIKQEGHDVPDELRHDLYTSLFGRMFVVAKEWETKLDIFHDNALSYLCGAVSDLIHIPIVTTMHMPVDVENTYIRVPPYITSKITNVYVPISHFQQKQMGVSTSSVIPNGIDISLYDFNLHGGGSMIWIGRINHRAPKGLKEAILLCKQTGRKLNVAGNVTDLNFYTDVIKPILGPWVHEFGVISEKHQKNDFYGNARAALFPIQWDEPFGFVFVEAMACGTPVIAYARGSVPEVVADGETGFVVNSGDSDIRGDWIIKKTGEEGMKEAMEKMYSMPQEQYQRMRRACRERVEKYFTVGHMIKNYERLYEKILASKIMTSD